MSDVETPKGETPAAQDLGTVAVPDTGSVSEPTPPQVEDKVSREEYVALQKEVEKARMRASQLENAQEKERQTKLQEKEEYKTLYEEAQAKLEEKQKSDEQQQAQKEAEDLRKRIISEYPDERTRQLAEQLIAANASNLVWGEVTSEDDAKADLFKQLDAIKANVSPGETPQKPQAKVHPNNPIPQPEAPEQGQDDLMNEAIRTGDWTKVLHSVPSIKAMASTFDEE